MKTEDFTAGLDRYGSDLSRWPAELRAEAEALLNAGPGAAWKDYRVARSMDAVLAEPVRLPGKRVLMERILAAAVAVPERFRLSDVFSAWQRRFMAGAVAASLAAGLVVGSWSGTYVVSTDADDYEDVPGLTFSPGDYGGWE